MGYKEYVESCIMESGLDETDELLEILESAETMEDVEAVEEYLTENSSDPTTEETNKKFNKLLSKLDSGMSTLAFGVALGAFVASLTSGIRSVIKEAKRCKLPDALRLMREVDRLEKQTRDVEKRCKAGEITAKEAKVETKKIQKQINALAKEARGISKNLETLDKMDAQYSNESVDITNLQLEIFEACESGTITEDDRDELLAVLEGSQEDYIDVEFREIGSDSRKSQTDEKKRERMEKIAKEASRGLDKIYSGALTLLTLAFLIRKIRKLMILCKDTKIDMIDSRIEKLASEIEAVERRRKSGAISKEEADKKTIALIKKTEPLLLQLAQSKEEKLEIKDSVKSRLAKLEKRVG